MRDYDSGIYSAVSFVSWVSSTPEYSKNNVATSRQGQISVSMYMVTRRFLRLIAGSREIHGEKFLGIEGAKPLLAEPVIDWSPETVFNLSPSSFNLKIRIPSWLVRRGMRKWEGRVSIFGIYEANRWKATSGRIV